MNKQEIRAQFLKERKLLSPPEYSQRCMAVSKNAIELIDESQAINIHLFLPIKKNQEVDTWPIYKRLIRSKGHTPILSKTHFKENSLSHHPMALEDGLEESSYGIPEPVHSRRIDPTAIDLVFVPLLAFDCSGNRVGYGAGFYDRFLAQCRKDSLKIGLSISKPFEGLIETNEFDIPLDFCITHEITYDFKTE